MVGLRATALFTAAVSLLSLASAQKNPKEDLILCDCGIGDNKVQPEWSTSRQVNWYKDIKWPDSAFSYPDAPDEAVEVPFEGGIYPWVPAGATATLPNGDVWTVYIEDGTPNGFKAGTAVTTKEGGQTLNCWAYRGRPVSAALNTTISDDTICWSAFVCNRDDHAPPQPDDMGGETSSTITSSAAPTTSVFTTEPATPIPTVTEGEPGDPAPTEAPQTGTLHISASVNPRFVNWPNTWDAFISNFIWDQKSGACVGPEVRGDGYNMTIECGGIQIDQDSHMTLLLIKALRDLGLNSLWFNQNPKIPAGTGNGTNSTSWVIMPEAFTLSATDVASQNIIGYLSYNSKYDGFLAGPCAACETARFNKDFFDPIIAAMQGTYPQYWSYTVQGQCEPWMVCK